jgi:1-deoxy-D-xylulose-5-phosphate synthase
MPNMTVMAPKCMGELPYMLKWALEQNSPVAIRYPRGGDDIPLKPLKNFNTGSWEYISGRGKIALVAEGKMVQHAALAAQRLKDKFIDVKIISTCFVKPIDKIMLDKLIDEGSTIITIEDNVVRGGLGSYILEYVNSTGKKTRVINLGFKDEFVQHGKTDILYKLYGLDARGIENIVLKVGDLSRTF